jgi:hypothetical protein
MPKWDSEAPTEAAEQSAEDMIAVMRGIQAQKEKADG